MPVAMIKTKSNLGMNDLTYYIEVLEDDGDLIAEYDIHEDQVEELKESFGRIIG